MPVTQSEFNMFRQFLESKSGIVLGDNKQYLVTSRLKKLQDEHGIKSLTELWRVSMHSPVVHYKSK